MGKVLKTELLKEAFDHLIKLRPEIYRNLRPYLQVNTFQKGEIIRELNEPEQSTHFIYTGTAALLFPAKKGRDYRVKIFMEGTVAADLNAYFDQSDSPFYLRALSYVSCFSLKKEAEIALLNEMPEISRLSTLINRELLEETYKYLKSFQLPIDEGFPFFWEQYKEERAFLSKKDLAFIFNTSSATITKLINQLP
ncbi:Crp/Fnr family transcriptional regulator [Echinicola vietnamensis]|uniref:cAMP-binding protein n=1 Tax=Echinicola vietnamensis (strain DSM 17526 / LMG 23754 / KMM 6221) TaxID=926556 RepID=L0G522_ECHVK|nr:cyclic nucleotide-binding domain-containing protein [Echinicola vietnamensis]AGA80637.1 cAMP-binding protein [Echinicola vietnamensis DSM 17526]